jgi:exodeoxyribonuclease V alpha subunit
VQDVMVFLQGHGVSPAFASRIYKKYGAQAISVVTANPYRLALEVWGIGFRSADALAQRLGIDRHAPARAEAGLLHVLGELTEEGNCHVPEHELLVAAEKMLDVPADVLADALERLAAAGHVVGEPLGDRGDCISLRPMYAAETRAAAFLARLVTTPRPVLPDAAVDEAIAAFEAARRLTLAPEQRAAVRAAARDKVVVITGGPGVGKTTIVQAIIGGADRRGQLVALGAPTGRAAKRLAETTGRAAMTLHRLLEFSPQDGAFHRNEHDQLDADVVICDEASMLDITLFAHLVAAVRPTARLVLVGDVDQLPSVGPGRVLHDVIASRAATVVRLTEIFRQAATSAIIVNAHRVNQGDMPDLAGRADFFFVERDDPEGARATILELAAERIPRRFGLDPLADVQVLSPMHRGDVGTIALNLALQERLNPPRAGAAELAFKSRIFRVGDKVIQNRNDYDKDVFNGDVGRILAAGADELIVDFDGRPVSYARDELDELGHAFTLSVHKSQGSEYPAVIVPVVTQHFLLLKRNLLYTAITRGKKLVVLVGSKRALGIAVRTDDTRLRWTWLAARIQEAVKNAAMSSHSAR